MFNYNWKLRGDLDQIVSLVLRGYYVSLSPPSTALPLRIHLADRKKNYTRARIVSLLFLLSSSRAVVYISHVSSVRAIAVVETFFFHPALVFASNRLLPARLVTRHPPPLLSRRKRANFISSIIRGSSVSTDMSEVEFEGNPLPR